MAFVDVGGIAAVAASTSTEDSHGKAIYTFIGPQALTFAEAAKVIGTTADRPISHRRLSSQELTGILLSAGMLSNYASIVVDNRDIAGHPPTSFVETVVQWRGSHLAATRENRRGDRVVPAPALHIRP